MMLELKIDLQHLCLTALLHEHLQRLIIIEYVMNMYK